MPNGIGKVLDGEAVIAEFFVVGFDTDLEGVGPSKIGPGDFREVENVRFDLLGEAVKIEVGQASGNGHRENLAVVGSMGNSDARSLGFGGEGVDGIDTSFDFIPQFLEIDAFLRSDVEIGPSPVGMRLNFLDAGKVLKGSVDGDDHLFFDILRAAPAIGHFDIDFTPFVGRLDLQRDFIEGRKSATKKNRYQQEVGSDVISSEPADHLR